MKIFYDKKFWEAVFTLTGAIIGAGILGLPYVFAQSGYLIGLFWIIFLGLIVGYVFLCLGEVSLRTKKTLQLTGYVKKYLGNKAEWIMFFSVIFGDYIALLAYLIGEGHSLSVIFTSSEDNALYFAFGFWIFMSLLLREGLRGLKKVESWGVIAILLILAIILVIYTPEIKYENLNYINVSNFFIPFGVVLFALIGFNIVPELEMIIKGKEKKFKKAITLGVLIPIIVYILFSLIFEGVLGRNAPEVATTSSIKLVTVLGIFTMMTSYFVLSFSLKDVFVYDLNLSKKSSYFLVIIFPLLIYLFLYFLNKLSFINVIGIGGVISGGITGILILLMNISSKKKGDRKPEYEMPINWFIILLISIIFIFGVIVELFF